MASKSFINFFIKSFDYSNGYNFKIIIYKTLSNKLYLRFKKRKRKLNIYKNKSIYFFNIYFHNPICNNKKNFVIS